MAFQSVRVRPELHLTETLFCLTSHLGQFTAKGMKTEKSVYRYWYNKSFTWIALMSPQAQSRTNSEDPIWEGPFLTLERCQGVMLEESSAFSVRLIDYKSQDIHWSDKHNLNDLVPTSDCCRVTTLSPCSWKKTWATLQDTSAHEQTAHWYQSGKNCLLFLALECDYSSRNTVWEKLRATIP